jgi:putative ABC transport system permease protein
VNLVTLALRNLGRRRARTAVVTLSVGLAVGMALSLLAVSESIENGTREGVDERGADFTVIDRDASDIFSGFIPQRLGPRLAAVPGVAGVAGELVTFAPVDHESQRLVVGWAEDSFFWRSMPVVEGRLPGSGESRVAILGAGTAQKLKKKLGDTLDIFEDQFRVVAIAGYQSALNRSLIILPLHDLQEIAFKSDQVTVFHIKLAPGLGSTDVDRVQQDLEKLGRLQVAPTDQLLSHDRNLSILKAISRAISWIALTLGGLSVLSALLMAIQERAREIGVMMAIGWNVPRTMASIVIEGLVIGIVGCVVGVVVSYLASFMFSSIPQIGNYLVFRPTIQSIAPTILAAIFLCALGSFYPAWRAAALTPAEAIRKL